MKITTIYSKNYKIRTIFAIVVIFMKILSLSHGYTEKNVVVKIAMSDYKSETDSN